ncbi:MAG: MotA/TolQ/ExbB proton channel family protein [Micromonosporaceae bacterium]|nr:MotA/TolQ/ExbB proton channel family protein [Micromonosporaceae bacterium]
MDPATIAGIGLAFASIMFLIFEEGGSITEILLPGPIVLVFGGSIGAAMAGGMLKDSLGALKSLQRAFLGKVTPPDALVDSIVKLAEKARREGLLALEDAMKDVEDPFLRKGLQLAIDGTDSDELHDILEAEVDAKRKSDKVSSKIFSDMGGYAPTIGIIGTCLGLVNVLKNLSEPESLGHMIAAAFVATLWGIMSANILFLPIGNRLKRLSELECAHMELVIAGIINIQAGANPRLVAQKLRSLMGTSAKAEAA